MSRRNKIYRCVLLFLMAMGSSILLGGHDSQSGAAEARPSITSERANLNWTAAAANPTQLAYDVFSPETAAQRLFLAWKNRNRRAALKVARRNAVNDLFQEKWAPMKPGKKFCEGEDFKYTCTYFTKDGLVLEMGVDKTGSMTYEVVSVSLFSAAH